MQLELTPQAKEAIEWVKKAGHPNELEGAGAPQEVINFVESHSCGDGFDYALWDGGYAKPEDWIVNYNPDKMTVTQLTEFKDIWEKNTIEF